MVEEAHITPFLPTLLAVFNAGWVCRLSPMLESETVLLQLRDEPYLQQGTAVSLQNTWVNALEFVGTVEDDPEVSDDTR